MPSRAERMDARLSLGMADDEVAIAYVGHLRALKRIDLLIAAVASLAEQSIPVRLVLAGGSRGAEDDVEGDLHQQVHALGLEERVMFTGVLADPRPVLWAADVFALASEREGLPNSLLEAMACGLACVAPASSAGDAVLHGGVGLVPVDAEGLHDALRSLALDAELRERLGAGAVERAAQYDVAAVADGYERLYARVAS